MSASNTRRQESRDTREDNENPPTLRSKGVFNRHFDVIESDISGTGGRGVARLDRLGLDAFNSRDKNYGETILGLAACGEAGDGMSKHPRKSRVECTH